MSDTFKKVSDDLEITSIRTKTVTKNQLLTQKDIYEGAKASAETKVAEAQSKLNDINVKLNIL